MNAPSSDQAGIRQAIRALRAGGYTLDRVYNGGDDDEPVSNEREAIAEIMAVDEATLWVRDSSGKAWGVFFVMGNSPDEVICDYHVSLSDVLDPLIDSWI
jgi:hypothetical protein